MWVGYVVSVGGRKWVRSERVMWALASNKEDCLEKEEGNVLVVVG